MPLNNYNNVSFNFFIDSFKSYSLHFSYENYAYFNDMTDLGFDLKKLFKIDKKRTKKK